MLACTHITIWVDDVLTTAATATTINFHPHGALTPGITGRRNGCGFDGGAAVTAVVVVVAVAVAVVAVAVVTDVASVFRRNPTLAGPFDKPPNKIPNRKHTNKFKRQQKKHSNTV